MTDLAKLPWCDCATRYGSRDVIYYCRQKDGFRCRKPDGLEFALNSTHRIAELETALNKANAELEQLRAECERAKAAAETWNTRYREANQRHQDEQARLGQQLVDAEAECERLRKDAINKVITMTDEQVHALARLEGRDPEDTAKIIKQGMKISLLEQETERLRRDAEIHRYEAARAQAQRDAIIKTLTHIYTLMWPEPAIFDGKRFSFRPPEALVRESWEGLSKAIREIPAAIDAASAEEKSVPCNLPFERIPQHADDPGFGPVPPKPNVTNIHQQVCCMAPETCTVEHCLLRQKSAASAEGGR